MDDAALVAAARRGDQAAWGTIYDRYADRLHDHCWSILRDEHEAADALHDAFVNAARALPQLRDPSRLRPWLYAIARNEAFRRQSALQLVDAMAPFVEIGVVNPAGLARYVLQYGFSIKDVSTLLNDPQQQQAQQAQINGVPPEQQGQMPPQGQPPMGDPMAGPMPTEGLGPPLEQMGAGAESIPPELLAAMQG